MKVYKFKNLSHFFIVGAYFSVNMWTHVVAYISVSMSIFSILGCVMFIPYLRYAVLEINDEMKTNMDEFNVGKKKLVYKLHLKVFSCFQLLSEDAWKEIVSVVNAWPKRVLRQTGICRK